MIKYILISIAFILALPIGIGLYDLKWSEFYQPKKENIRREVFENTQSFVQGKTQELAKYFEEYSKADADGKETVRQIIIMQFSDFDESKMRSAKLKQFLTEMRGY